MCTEEYKLSELQDECISYISRMCDFEIWYKYWNLLQQYNNTNILYNIQVIIDTWASNNISDIFGDGKISSLQEIHIQRILLTENIKISNENKFLEYLVRWCNYQITIYKQNADDVNNQFLLFINHIQWNDIVIKDIQSSGFSLDEQTLSNLKANNRDTFVHHSRRYDIINLVNNQFEGINISSKRPRDEDNFIYDDSDEEFYSMIKKQKMV